LTLTVHDSRLSAHRTAPFCRIYTWTLNVSNATQQGNYEFYSSLVMLGQVN